MPFATLKTRSGLADRGRCFTFAVAMSHTVPAHLPSLPGNKRRAELALRADGDELVVSPSERAAFLTAHPAMLTTGRLAADDAFVMTLAESSPEVLASKYGQRRGSYGHAVIRSLAGEVSTRVERSILDRDPPDEWLIPTIRLNTAAAATFTCWPAGAVPAKGRVRVRRQIWRELAIETLLALGAGRCLASGCITPPRERRAYCLVHRDLERTYSPSAARFHDAAMAGVADLLEEVGEFLGVPKP